MNHENVLIVSHGGVYACLCAVMGWDILDLKNCEPVHHVLSKQSGGWQIRPLGNEGYYWRQR
jgi:hypothetical protein